MENNPRPLFFFLLLALVAVNVELDIFLPCLPEMQTFFGAKESTMSWVLSLNFFGLCLSGFFCGYISDAYGRKNVILWGMAFFVIGSVGCVLTNTMSLFLLARFIQGLGCGAPVACSFAAILDVYSERKATQMISLFNGVITGALVGAPLLGILLSHQWGWRANFIFIAGLAIIASLLLLFYFKETLKEPKIFTPKKFVLGMQEILASSSFWTNGYIAILMYSSLIAFVANAPLLMMNHLRWSQNHYGMFQASIMLAFVLASFMCAFLLKKVSISTLTRVGIYFALVGSSSLLFATNTSFSFPFLILSLVAFNVGAAFLIAIFSTRVMEKFAIKGMASSLIGSLRLFTGALFISFSSLVYNGTLLPLAWLIFISTVAATLLLLLPSSKTSA